MALDASDIDIIKASWLCVRQDQVSSGCLLFKELFTRYPQYLPLFSQFPDLDLNHMRENKKLLNHAIKVIKTVSFVVDSLGDDKQTRALNEALVNLVKSHLSRKIGLEKFRNLGEVLIDFVCNLNHLNGEKQLDGKKSSTTTDNDNEQQLNKRKEIDSKSLRSSWSKLYDIILSLVKQEEANATTV